MPAGHAMSSIYGGDSESELEPMAPEHVVPGKPEAPAAPGAELAARMAVPLFARSEASANLRDCENVCYATWHYATWHVCYATWHYDNLFKVQRLWLEWIGCNARNNFRCLQRKATSAVLLIQTSPTASSEAISTPKLRD